MATEPRKDLKLEQVLQRSVESFPVTVCIESPVLKETHFFNTTAADVELMARLLRKFVSEGT